MRTQPSSAKKSSTASPRGAASEDAIALLMSDHREVEAMFKDYDKLVEKKASGEEKQQLAGRICLMLTLHATVEEEIFYPAARQAMDEEDLLDEAVVEHASAKDLIAQIESSGPQEDLYDAKVKVLSEYIKHHVKEEETEMFPKLRKSKAMDLAELGERMKARKAELAPELAEGDLH